jgi:hypothetical protein
MNRYYQASAMPCSCCYLYQYLAKALQSFKGKRYWHLQNLVLEN